MLQRLTGGPGGGAPGASGVWVRGGGSAQADGGPGGNSGPRWMAFYQEEGLGTGLERSRLDQLKKAWSTCRGSAFGGMCSNALGRCRRRNGQGDEGGGLPVVRGQPSVG